MTDVRRSHVIETEYVSVDMSSARIVARAVDGRSAWVHYPFPKRGGDSSVYEEAAKALCEKMGWSGDLVGGRNPRDGCTFVLVEEGSE